jgi:hypothetical protein
MTRPDPQVRPADNALDDHPDARHPAPRDRPDPLAGAPAKGRTVLKPGGLSEAEQLLNSKADRQGR